MPRKELTPYQRGEIAGARKIGSSWTTIKDTFKVAIRSARNTVAIASRRDNGASQRRQGRPKSYSDRDERSILRIIRKDPTLSYSQVKR